MEPQEFRAAREAMGLTQTGLASKLGVSLKTVQNLESGASPIKPVHEMALGFLSMQVAIDKKLSTLISKDARKLASEVSRLLIDERWL